MAKMLNFLFKKFLSFFTIFILLLNQLLVPTLVLAQEATPEPSTSAEIVASPTPDATPDSSLTPAPTEQPTESPSPTPEPTVTPSPEPAASVSDRVSDSTDSAVPQASPEPTVTPTPSVSSSPPDSQPTTSSNGTSSSNTQVSPSPTITTTPSPTPQPDQTLAKPVVAPTVSAQVTQTTDLTQLINLLLNTNKGDYQPGDFVTVTGSGFLPGETVSLTFNETPYQHPDNVILTTANEKGEISNQDFLINENDLGASFTLVAKGLTSGYSATTVFTDNLITSTVSVSCTANPVTVGSGTSCTGSVNKNGNKVPTGTITFSNSGNGSFSSTNCSLSLSGNKASCSVTYTPSAVETGTQTISVSYPGDSNFTSGNASTSLNINTKALTVSGITASNKVYDGTTTATVDTSGATLIGVQNGDSVSLTGTATGTFASKNVGTGITVTVSGLSLTGTNVSNYTLSTPTTTANITQKSLTVTGVTASDKVYDGTTTATLNTTNAALSGKISGDVVNLTTTSAVGVFDNKNVGTNKTVSVSGLTIGGAQASNYSLTQPTTTASITQKALTISASGVNKGYDGTATASASLSDDRLSGDILTASYQSASFSDKNVGTGKAVNVSGISISGTDSGNYSYNTTASTTANITTRAITVSAVTSTKNYDGTATSSATPTITNGSLASGDISQCNQTFDSTSIGTNKTLTPSCTITDGNSGNNYSITYATASGTITVFGSSSFALPTNTLASSTPTLTASTDVTINIDSQSSVFIPSGTIISSPSGNFDLANLTSSVLSSSAVSGLSANQTAQGVVQWGLAGVELDFNSPITVNIYVGSAFNGQTLNVYRSESTSSGWTQDGLVSTTCTVSSGLCTFRTSKASNFVATQTVASTSTGGTGAGGGDGRSDGLGCASHDCSVRNAVAQVLGISASVNGAGFGAGVLGASVNSENVGIGQEGQVKGEATTSSQTATQAIQTPAPAKTGLPFNIKVALVVLVLILGGFGLFRFLVK